MTTRRAIESVLDEDSEFNVVAEVTAERNRDVVKDIAPDRVSVIDTEEILAKIMVQTSRTSGLSVVYSELLSFEGCEIYFHNDPRWHGTRFDQLQFQFPDGVPIGLRRADDTLLIRPPLDMLLNAEDEVLIVAEDDSTIRFRPSPVMIPKARDIPGRRIERVRERQLILGWSPKAPTIIAQYSDYVLEGSEIDVMLKDPSKEIADRIRELSSQSKVHVKLVDKDPLVGDELESMKPFSYNNVIILPQNVEAKNDPERIDAETIVVLLHLRKQQKALVESGRIYH